MSLLPSRRTITGTGTPRLIKETLARVSTSGLTVAYTATTADDGIAIDTKLVSAGYRIKAGTSVGKITGISGSTYTVAEWLGGTPASDTLFEVEKVLWMSGNGTAYGATSAADSGGVAGVKVGMRLSVAQANGKTAYAKVRAVDGETNIITVDAWVNGVPANGEHFVCDGWIVDLPHCKRLTETFAPFLKVKTLWRGRKSVKQYGWQYEATLDYGTFLDADSLFFLRRALESLPLGDHEDNIVFIPHTDKRGRNYNVFFSDPISLALHPSGYGHEDVTLRLTGKENAANISAYGGYGMGYGTRYGTGL